MTPDARHRLLVVDDDGELLDSLCRILRNSGFDVSAAPDAESALDQLDAVNPHVVVTDLRLPGRSGLELLQLVRSRMPHVPVIIMTAYGDDATRDEASRMGVFSLLTKPVFKEQLLATLRKAIVPVGAKPDLAVAPARR